MEILYRIGISILTFAVVYAIKKLFDKKLEKAIKHIKDKDRRTLFELLTKVFWYIILAISIMFILNLWKIDVTPILAGVGIASIILAFAMQSIISNFFSGLFIASDESIRIGDLIEIPERKIVGYVEQINWRSTRIRTIKNNIVYVPNSYLANTLVINYSQPMEEVLLYVDVGVSYFEDLEKVEKVAYEVAREVQNNSVFASKDWDPRILFYKFGDSNIYLRVILKARDYLSIRYLRHELIKKLKERFDKENIEISFPNVNVFFRYGKESYKIK